VAPAACTKDPAAAYQTAPEKKPPLVTHSRVSTNALSQAETKWGNLSQTLKRVKEWPGGAQGYFEAGEQERKAAGFPANFGRDVFDALLCAQPDPDAGCALQGTPLDAGVQIG
jgi:hypothetical protein